ncbi:MULTISPECIES: hypothetical protein [unclassified Acidovorax]|uniref:hypothetical protein n=1 Tax=unclassified Acidovorax TaxID=2684926 RepID=UPI001C473B5E|nr:MULTISPECIES: hypothetical protein [unclassified Acidovorax]MBV7428309.1 hypothetical protein [Acidovorax sp. sif0732]MBV7449566.1 hypothetical protein [Acidovorax sp. sif0715]
MFNRCHCPLFLKVASVVKDMLQTYAGISLHRVAMLPFPGECDGPASLVALPLVASCTDAQDLRKTLHSALGARLRGYRMCLDRPRERASLSLLVQRKDVLHTVCCVMRVLPHAEFGRVVKVAGAEEFPCH